MTDNTAEITIAILIASTVFITKEEYVVQAWCGIGGVMSGYVGSMLFPIKGMQMRVRCQIALSLRQLYRVAS